MIDVNSLADAVAGAETPDNAWCAFSGRLAAAGLRRTALHTALSLSADNPFADDQAGMSFGSVWNPAYDRRLRRYNGNLRKAKAPDIWHLRPTLLFLAVSRSPLFIDHRKVVATRNDTAFKPLCRIMIEELGQYQGLAFPLRDPRSGKAAILSAWGDEDSDDFSDFVRAHRETLHMAGHYFMGMLGAKWPGLCGGDKIVSHSLSGRECQVLSLFANGLRTATIADRLRISDRSVTEYVLRARKKLGARTRIEAVARATMLGLL